MAGVLSRTGGDGEPYLARLSEDQYGGPALRAVYHVTRGEADQTLEWAAKALDQRYTGLLAMVLRPFQPRLEHSPAWPAVMKKMNLTSSMKAP